MNDDRRVYRVVRNDEDQYSIWPVDRDLPPGWHAEPFEGARAECLSHIDRVWTDMRPRSLRERMAAAR
jgi:MbtH protein